MTRVYSDAISVMALFTALFAMTVFDPSRAVFAFSPSLVSRGGGSSQMYKNAVSRSSLKFSAAVTEETAIVEKTKKSKVNSAKTKKSSKKKKRNGMKVNGEKRSTVRANGPTVPSNKSNRKSKKNAKTKKSSKTKKNRIRKPLSDISLGSKISGKVVDICPFGAFIETEYAVKGSHYGCALLHISQIKDEKVKDISKELKIGQKINDLRVINIDYKKAEVALSLRKPRPKRKLLSSVMVGDEIEGRVARIANYGAFVDVGCNVDALVHISRISQDKINNIHDHLKVGQIVPVRIIEVDGEKKTLAASMLDLQADQYLNRRREMKERQKRRQKAWEESQSNKSDAGFFEDAIKELEETFQEDYGGWSSSKQ